jgi:GT2 family glycosyltransferase
MLPNSFHGFIRLDSFVLIALLLLSIAFGVQSGIEEKLFSADSKAIPLLSISLNDDSRNFLGRLIRSIDYPINEVYIQIGNEDPLIRADLVSKIQLAKLDKPNLNIKVTVLNENPGSAVGFNFGLRNMMVKSDSENFNWVLIVNSDIAFYPGILRRLAGSMEHFIRAHSTFGIGFTSLCCGGEWSAIGVTRRLVEKIGFFDENMYPAYYEDDDYGIRIHHSGMHAVKFNNTPLLHGTIDGSKDYESGIFQNLYVTKDRNNPSKSSWRKVYEFGVKRSKSYIEKKWGSSMGSFKNAHGNSVKCKDLEGINKLCSTKYSHPFNDPSKNLSYWELDLANRKEILAANKRYLR